MREACPHCGQEIDAAVIDGEGCTWLHRSKSGPPTHQPVRFGRPTHALLAVEFNILCDIAQRRSSAGLGRGNTDRAARACR